MKRYHKTALDLLKVERARLVRSKKYLKGVIAELSRENPYGGTASFHMKLSHQLTQDIKDVELSIKVLREDFQSRNQKDFDREQAAKSFKAQQNSYNCLGGC